MSLISQLMYKFLIKAKFTLSFNLDNIKTVLYCAKAFMDKLNLVDVTVYMRNKM